jgi:alpha-mannosidase
MDETPGFHFSASSAAFYLWVERTDRALFEAIRRRVAEGRWEIVGGFYIEPDCNLPCGESFVRHGLYSQRHFQEAFGTRASTGFNPDSFGHAGTLPQILRKLGMDAYAYARPEPGREREYPEGTTFWWEAADGSRVLASHIPLGYDGANPLAKVTALCNYPHRNANQRDVLCLFGVGNHGGGPTKRAIAEIEEMRESTDGPEVRFSTLSGYFDAVRANMAERDIPTVRGPLRHHARGCYSAHAELKRLNRQVEHAIMTAERFATAAWLLEAKEYPHDQFRKAWLDLLYNQFHDILGGTSIPSAYEDTRDQLGAARHRAHVAINDALQTISRDIDTTAEGNTVVVVNPLTWPVEQPVAVEPVVARELEQPIHFVDETGAEVPSQAVRHERAGSVRYVFTAELPATGYRLFHARSGARPKRLMKRLDVSRTAMENEWWRIEFDPCDGHLCRLYDRVNHAEVLRRGAVLACLADGSDTWSHDVDAYTAETGRFGAARLCVVEEGDVLATVQVHSTWNRSEAIQETTIYRDLDVIDHVVHINWQERHTALKLLFETRVSDGVVTAEAPYGFQARDQEGREDAGGQWLDLSGAVDGLPYGFALVNDGAYAFDAHGGVLGQTILRSPAFAHHAPSRCSSLTGREFMDQGWHTVQFRIVPHAGPWQKARVVKRAWELNVPIITQHESSHPGPRAAKAQLMGTEAENVLLSTLKQSETGEDLIVRGYEVAGEPATTTLHLPYLGKSFELSFAPHEIKTVRIDPRTWEIREVNLLEE